MARIRPQITAQQTFAHDEVGDSSFDVMHDGQKMGRMALSVTGEHNVLNALSAIAAADYSGYSICVYAERSEGVPWNES